MRDLRGGASEGDADAETDSGGEARRGHKEGDEGCDDPEHGADEYPGRPAGEDGLLGVSLHAT